MCNEPHQVLSEDAQEATRELTFSAMNFPIAHLGTLLLDSFMHRIKLQSIIDKSVMRLHGWKAKQIALPCWVELVKSTLSAWFFISSCHWPIGMVHQASGQVKEDICLGGEQGSHGGQMLGEMDDICKPRPSGSLTCWTCSAKAMHYEPGGAGYHGLIKLIHGLIWYYHPTTCLMQCAAPHRHLSSRMENDISLEITLGQGHATC